MRNRTRRRNVGRRQAAAGGAAVNPAFVILTITDDLGVALVTTAAAHGIGAGEPDLPVVVSGTSNATYNGAQLANMVSETTFYISTAYDADSTGGTWRRA